MGRFVWKRNQDIFKGIGIYHVTFVISDRQPLLGQLVSDIQAPRVERTSLGSTFARTIENLPVYYQGLKIITKCIMPDHIHLLLHLYEDHGYSIREISRGLRQAWRKDYLQSMGVKTASTPSMSVNTDSTPSMGVKTDSTPSMSVNINRQIVSAEPYKHISQSTSVNINRQIPSAEPYPQTEVSDTGTQPPLFEPPFFRTLAHKGQLDAMIQYIHDNPRRAMLKQLNPDLFVLRRDTRVRDLCFSSLGNLFLLDYPDKQSVICSRTLSEQQIAAQLTDVLHQAGNGCVTVTAAISPGERQIAKAVREAGFPLIILLKDGFPKAGDPHEKFYKPGGLYFEACAAGRLLLLEPTADTLTLPNIQTRTEQALREKAEAGHWNYQPIPVSSDRYRMMASNEIVKILCP